MIEKILVANVKCGGCVKAIQDGLGKVNGIDRIEVTIETGTVEVEGANLDKDLLTAKLAELGYPAISN